jgi:hypothetical protein
MSYAVDEILVGEDSGLADAQGRLEEVFFPLSIPTRFFVHANRRGIASSMDELFRNVRTPYILHLEDDWVCTAVAGDFIERSILILEDNPQILQVGLRPPFDGHPPEEGLLESGQARYRLLKTGVASTWHGYSNNPNVRRIREYELLPAGYAFFERSNSVLTEAEIGKFYFERGFVAAVLCQPDAGFVHIGVSRSVDGHVWGSPQNLDRLLAAERKELRWRGSGTRLKTLLRRYVFRRPEGRSIGEASGCCGRAGGPALR